MKGPWKGSWPLSTTWRYSSGALHAAWDVAMPRGTDLYAIGDGTVVDCEDGHPDPAPRRYPGMPSNWIILRFTFPAGPYKGKTGHAYYQHLTKGGVKVRKGQNVRKGQVIGKSGSSGNSTGPHLHLVVLKPGFAMTRWSRYNYMNNPVRMVVWPISQAWGGTVRHVYMSRLKPGVDNSASVRELRRVLIKRGRLEGDPKKPGNKYTGKVVEAVKKVQRKMGKRETGVFTYKQARDFFKPNSKIVVVKE